jgi:hypothetical protein
MVAFREKKLEDHFPMSAQAGRVSTDAHAVGRRRRTRWEKAGDSLYLDEAEPAGPDLGEFLNEAERGYDDPVVFRDFEDRLAGFGADAFTVNG